MSPSKINWYLLFKLPAAWFTGVRVSSINSETCITKVRFRWINQNPFRSMFWAVQGMAAELSTGALLMSAIQEQNRPISMLLLESHGSFVKKARGKILFSCESGKEVREGLNKALETGEGQLCRIRSTGRNSENEVVSEFEFVWTIKPKS
ncbi:DUF4442 domain-containing protein [Aureitalea marina]|uniref:Thioesterase n=1 Tax=Aureitalea marina TaxID=930804 RepID=A0A2S7KTP9_9FLAO|nr:DUF4442 domain-containing protein [Aureitalea marina]PQB05990.1 thioesterase [Aureitalea marina]